MILKNSLQPIHRNLASLALMSVLQAVHAIILVGLIQSLIPFKPNAFVQSMFPVYWPEVRPEREMLLFRLAVLLSLGLMAVWVRIFKDKLSDGDVFAQVRAYLLFSSVSFGLQLGLLFKFFVWPNAQWALWLSWFLVVANVLAHIFWPELKRCLNSVVLRCNQPLPMSWQWPASVIAVIVVFVLIFPSLERVLARTFVWDQFYHLDSMIMMPGWAHVKGLVLNVDVTSQYSIAVPLLFSNVLNAFGKFDYPSVMMFLVLICFAYYAGLFFILARWLGSRAWALAGMVLALKWQMFHFGVAPLCWQYPSAMALRHWPDAVFFALCLSYTRSPSIKKIYGMAVCVGLSLFWMMDVGVYLLVAFVFLMALTRPLWAVGGVIASATTFALCHAIAQPSAFFQSAYWANQGEFASLFIQGWGALPITNALQEKQFFAMVLGFVIILGYVLNLVFSLGTYWENRARKHALYLVVLSVYGLGLYHYYIHRSGVTSYWAVGIPLAMISVYYLKVAVEFYCTHRAVILGRVFASGVVMLIPLSFLFQLYPAWYIPSLKDARQEVSYYTERFDFKTDAALITRLTTPDERVAIISSFETKILMQANRAPLFYYSPTVESSLMDNPQSRLTYLHTWPRVRKTLAQMQDPSVNYIFVEAKMVNQKGQQALEALLKAIEKDFTPVAKGQYLVAYHRRAR